MGCAVVRCKGNPQLIQYNMAAATPSHDVDEQLESDNLQHVEEDANEQTTVTSCTAEEFGPSRLREESQLPYICE